MPLRPAHATLRRLLRLSAMWLLLCAVAAMPVLAAAADTHAAAHGDVAHLHDGGTAEPTQAGGHGDPGERLHALAHAAHCCGQMAAMVPEVVAGVLPAGASSAPDVVVHATPTPRLPALIRPPIAA